MRYIQREVKGINKNILAIGIIFLFIGLCVQPTFAYNIRYSKEEQQQKNNPSITTNPVFTSGETLMKTSLSYKRYKESC